MEPRRAPQHTLIGGNDAAASRSETYRDASANDVHPRLGNDAAAAAAFSRTRSQEESVPPGRGDSQPSGPLGDGEGIVVIRREKSGHFLALTEAPPT